MPVTHHDELEITAFEWVPRFAQGVVRDLRPRWACNELGLPFKIRLISAVNRPEWYFSEQPFGQVPFLRDGEIGVFESGAMLIHLAEKAGVLPPIGSPERALILGWLFAAFNSIEPLEMEFAQIEVFARNEEWARLRKPSLVTAMDARLARLAAALGNAEWFAGTFSIADIAMASTLRAIADPEILPRHPKLVSYVARATDRPAFQTALSDQLATFAKHSPNLEYAGT